MQPIASRRSDEMYTLWLVNTAQLRLCFEQDDSPNKLKGNDCCGRIAMSYKTPKTKPFSERSLLIWIERWGWGGGLGDWMIF